MSNYAKYLYLFKTVLIEKLPSKFIIGQIKIEIFNEQRIYEIPSLSSSILSKESSLSLMKTPMVIPKLREKEHYIAIIARTKEREPKQARMNCEEEINRIITNISIIYDPSLFSDLVYRGWIIDDSNIFTDSLVKFSEKISIDGEIFYKNLKEINKRQNLNQDIRDRIKLMSKFYSKSIVEKSEEPRFIWLWTILEIYPISAVRLTD
jgi:hypothetical protein